MQHGTHVKNSQLKKLGQFLRNHGVSEKNFDSFLADEKKVENFCNSLKVTDNGWFEKLQIEANKIGGRVHIFENVVVDYSRTHNEAAIAGGPQTPSNYNVLKVGDQYPQKENKKVTKTFIAFNWPKGGGSFQKAANFGTSNGLGKTVSYDTFAIGENFPKLNYELGPNPMYMVETTGCTFDGYSSACNVWWYDSERKARLSWQNSYGNGSVWFLFEVLSLELK
jgi:hypothetical protein